MLITCLLWNACITIATVVIDLDFYASVDVIHTSFVCFNDLHAKSTLWLFVWLTTFYQHSLMSSLSDIGIFWLPRQFFYLLFFIYFLLCFFIRFCSVWFSIYMVNFLAI